MSGLMGMAAMGASRVAQSAEFPRISRITKIDAKQFMRQDWQYAFHLILPPILQGKYGAIAGQIFNDTALTVLIPYMQSQDVSRPGATFVTPTLGGGKHIEDHGRIKEAQTIAGTSGFLAAVAPAATLFDRYKSNVQRGFTKIDTSALDEKGKRSGYAWFHRFMNLFELYWQIKRQESADLANKTKLVFVDEKDEGFWIAAPLSFAYQRSSSGLNKMTYNWNVSLEIIECFDRNPAQMKSPLPAEEINIFKLITEIAETIQKGIEAIVAAGQLTIGFVKSAIDVVINAFRSVIGIIDALQQGAYTIANTLFEAGAAIVDGIMNTGIAAMRAIQGFYGLGSAIEKAFNEAWLSGVQATEALFAKAREFSAQSYPEKRSAEAVKYAGTRAFPGGSPSILAKQSRSLQQGPDYSEETDANNIGSTATASGIPLQNSLAGSRSKRGLKGYEGADGDESRSTWTDVKTIPVNRGDTIFTIAKRELGAISYWQDLVILNNLQPPYVTDDTSSRKPGVLVFGEAIRIPIPSADRRTTELTGINQTARAEQASGIATSGTTTALTDSTKTVVGNRWRVNQWEGFTCSIITGTNAGESSLVESNDFDTITLVDTFPLANDTTSVYVIWLDQAAPAMPNSNDDIALGFDFLAKRNSRGMYDTVIDSNGDAAVVTGIAAFVQSMGIAFDTRLGANPWIPGDGMYSAVGTKATAENIMLYRMYARRVVSADTRVDEILSETIIVGENSDIIGIEIECVLTGGFKTTISSRR